MHIFTGENGARKSTILYLLTTYTNHASLIPGIHKDHLEDFKVNISVQLQSNIDVYKVVSNNGNISFSGFRHTFLNEYFQNLNSQNYSYRFAFFGYSGYRNIGNARLRAIQELNNPPLADALSFNSSGNPQLLLQWIANTKTKEALALAKKDEKGAEKYRNSINKIELAVSEITDSKIEFELNDNPLSVSIKVNDTLLDFELLPDGLKSIISWIADLLMRMDRITWVDNIDVFERNFILFLDEIEVHLHPKWQRKILPVIKRLFKNAQIFISTHSPFVIGSVDGAWVYKFKKEGAYSKLDGEPILSEDANSYRVILEEVFGIEKQFGIAVEKQLDRFYELKNLGR